MGEDVRVQTEGLMQPGERQRDTKRELCSHWVLLPLLLCAVAGLVAVTVALVMVLSNKGASEPRAQSERRRRPPCEEDWIWYRGKCYYFSETYDEWNNSQSFCASHNASLSLIDTQEELDFLRRHKGFQDHWIGLYRDAERRAWVWANGSLFNNMFRIEGTAPCVLLNNLRVDSAACNGDRRWICNKMDTNTFIGGAVALSMKEMP
ncbi:hypothetical protein XENTR_v10017698 [Xenopus tropicalis]|uniref:C-type lectin domain family 2 member B n=1 Tax=Xenopus tropicalis TaxID=8364 RepID=A0A6I8RY56_XENTR|nr:C-type lectin domain family 2 member B [Xenopus tropicalis]KAE8589689.1 hypothetical protein XENTR_v10017698 [Xenopus tropicalis]